MAGIARAGQGGVALVVEGATATRLAACGALARAGHRAVGHASADAALAWLRSGNQSPPWLLFTDIHAPAALDGLQLASQAIAGWPGTRVLLTSAVLPALPSGMPPRVGFLPKPYSVAELLTAVDLLAREG